MSYINLDEEIYAIKERLSAAIKGMTAEEEIAFIKVKTDPVHNEFGIRTVDEIKAGMLMKGKAVSS